ncbi:competence/damage-inducible protein A [Sphingobacterium sp. LRF_L2]|uniref:competence/damage-inducible protein A n=1 Tax=Sphingobacterium sp. LRF_L2 TaxID=3369421 RepID=UPI003F63A2BF
MQAEIITIGDEILNGQIVDTNSAWIAQRLATLSIPIVQISSIADRKPAIVGALKDAEGRADVIIVTGGLGPTKDDVTKTTIAEYFQTHLIRDPQVLSHVQHLFERSGHKDMPEINKQQADVLAGAEVLFNDVGTAPGMAIKKDGRYYAFLPGVPFEMKFLIENRVLPFLTTTTQGIFIHNEHILTIGIGESHLARRIADIEEEMPDYIKLAYLPKLGLVRLRLTAKGIDKHSIINETQQFAKRIIERLEDHVVVTEDLSFEEVIVREFTRESRKVATAESCTGGQIAASLTAVAGASRMFEGAIVAYANKVKTDVLGVDAVILEDYGAVSEATVKAMAEGAKRRLNTDYAIATSGIAGPTGATETKPVGMVCVAVAGLRETKVNTFYFKNDRAINIERASVAGLTMLWNLFVKEKSDILK